MAKERDEEREKKKFFFCMFENEKYKVLLIRERWTNFNGGNCINFQDFFFPQNQISLSCQILRISSDYS